MITRKNVAEKAGVSVTIVSRVLNNNGYVAKEKREAVLRAAQELSYRPNPIALSLQSRRTRQILFYNKDLGNMFTIELYRGMVKYAKQYDYMVSLSGSFNFDRIKTMMFDGIILPNEHVAMEFAKKSAGYTGLPAVSAAYGDTLQLPKNIPMVMADTSEAMELLIHYLWENGHKKIALATPYPVEAQSRTLTFLSMLRPIYKSHINSYVIVSPDSMENESKRDGFTEEDFNLEGIEAAKQFVKRKLDATAVVCFNDSFALGMVGQLEAMDVRIPEDVSVAGIDGISDHYGCSLVPKLTSVSLFPMRQGAECVRILLEMIEDESRVKSKTKTSIKLLKGDTVKTLPNKDKYTSIVI